MPFPPATLNHTDASPLLKDQPPGEVHVVPSNDAKLHIVQVGVPCWCDPQRHAEGEGYATLLHHPIKPVVKGHTLGIKKVLIGVKEGVEFVVELSER